MLFLRNPQPIDEAAENNGMAAAILSQGSLSFIAKAFAVFVAIYFPMMTGILLTIDAELNATSTTAIGWLMQGRWTTYILTQIMFRPVIPYFTMAFFGVCAASAYTIFLASCGLFRGTRSLVVFAVLIGFPVWSTLLEFPANTTAAGIALILCAIAAAAIADRPYRPIVLLGQVAAVTFAIGVYQSFVFIYCVVALGVIYFRMKNFRETLPLVIAVLIVSALSVILHLVIQTVWLRMAGLSEAYIGLFYHPKLLITDFWVVSARSFATLFGIYAGRAATFGLSLWCTPLLIVLALIVATRRSLLGTLLLVAALLSPLPLLLMAGGSLPLRSLIAAPIALGFCALIVVNAHAAYLRYAGVAITVGLALQSAAAISQYQAARELTAKFDQTTAAEIYYRIAEVANDGPKTVDLYGSLQGPQIYPVIPRDIGNSTAGASFFSWDGGNPWRMLTYMKMVGYSDLNLAPAETRQALKSEFVTMPIWPAPGSVRRVNDIVLVRLSDQPGLY